MVIRLSILLSICLMVVCPKLYGQETNEEESDEEFYYQSTPFDEVKQYPNIRDSVSFIQHLKMNCHLGTLHRRNLIERINYFKKVRLYGGNHFIYLIEYDFKNGYNVEYPFKRQMIFDSTGKLMKILRDLKVDVVNIFPNKLPFLFTLWTTTRGNGGHNVYRLRSDTLEQIYDGFLDTRPQTYSTGDSYTITEPNELCHKFVDINKDGYNDIIFWGKLHFAVGAEMNIPKSIPVKYIFLYNKKTGHFIEKEDYSKKYEYIYGNTK